MALFDTGDDPSHQPLVIVPPKPEFAYSQDELSYSHLHYYDEGSATAAADAPGGAAAAGAAADTSLVSLGTSGHGSGKTLSSSTMCRAASATTVGSGDEASPIDKAPERDTRNEATGEEQAAVATPPPTPEGGKRNPHNGAFTFKVNAEYDMLMHVQQALDRHRKSGSGDQDDVALCRVIMRSVDEYCLRKQWMYHIGSQKGAAIGRFLRGGAVHFRQERAGTPTFICVELGTYCGYSALLLAATLRQFARDLASSESTAPPFEFHIYTTEVSSKVLTVAQSVFRLAKVDARITPLLVAEGDGTPLSATLRARGVDRIDFLLLDHAKHRYLDDLRDLEGAAMLRAGSRVSADNVVFNRLDAYRQHVRRLEGAGAAESRLEEMNLEYSNNLKDGIEMTVYLKDPPTMAIDS